MSLQKDVIVNGNLRVYKAVKSLFRENHDELQRLEKVSVNNSDLIEFIRKSDKRILSIFDSDDSNIA